MDLEYNITYRQKDKGWQYLISYKENNKWRQKAKQGFNTKKEAKFAADKRVLELKKELNTTNIINAQYNYITFSKLSDDFIKHSILYKEHNTINNYRFSIKAFNNISNIKVIDIKRIDIQNCIDDLIQKGLKESTIKGYIKSIKLIFDYYTENYNSLFSINLKKFKIPVNKSKKEKKALSKNELDNLLFKIKDNKYYIAALIAGKCGLRESEICGLTWDNVDFSNMELTINKQWKIDKSTNKSVLGALKSKNSYRVVPIPLELIKYLKTFKESNPIDINNRILPCSASNIRKYLVPDLKKYAGVSLHELRHTYITILIANGLDFKTVARLAGHDVEQTIKTYSHVTDDMMEKASKKIHEIF